MRSRWQGAPQLAGGRWGASRLADSRWDVYDACDAWDSAFRKVAWGLWAAMESALRLADGFAYVGASHSLGIIGGKIAMRWLKLVSNLSKGGVGWFNLNSAVGRIFF